MLSGGAGRFRRHAAGGWGWHGGLEVACHGPAAAGCFSSLSCQMDVPPPLLTWCPAPALLSPQTLADKGLAGMVHPPKITFRDFEKVRRVVSSGCPV